MPIKLTSTLEGDLIVEIMKVKPGLYISRKDRKHMVIVCTISFERPVNYLCDAWHVFPPKYEAWTHFNN